MSAADRRNGRGGCYAAQHVRRVRQPTHIGRRRHNSEIVWGVQLFNSWVLPHGEKHREARYSDTDGTEAA